MTFPPLVSKAPVSFRAPAAPARPPIQFGRDSKPVDAPLERLNATFDDEASRARHNILEVLTIRNKPSIADRFRNIFNRMFGVKEPPKLIANLKESDIRIAYPTDFKKFQTDGYLVRGVVVTVDSDDSLHQVVDALNHSLGMFTPIPDSKAAPKYYKYFDTPVEFIIGKSRQD